MNRHLPTDLQHRALANLQENIERNDGGSRQQALNHHFTRNVRVVQLLAYMALLRQAGAAFTGPIQCVAARCQNFSSSQTREHMGMPTGPSQAAHFMPGHILIGGREVQKFASSTETQGHIEFLFCEVEHLGLPFNQADSAAEAKGKPDGLCHALTHACETLVNWPAMAPEAKGKISLDLVQAAYEDWHSLALIGLRNGAAIKASGILPPPLVGDPFEGYTLESVSARSTISSGVSNRDDSNRILGHYIDTHPTFSWQWMVARCHWAFEEVESNFKG